VVPVEFIGRARQLRRDLIAATTASRLSMVSLLAPLRRGISRRGSMRQEEIAGALRLWKLAPAPRNRVSLSIQMRGDVATIEEMFIVSSDLQRPGWGIEEWEPGLVVSSASIRLAPRKVEMVDRDLAALSLHSIARRFQRGANAADRSDAAVMADLSALAGCDPDTMAPGARLVWPAGRGRWVGETVAVDGKMTALIRSFFDADMVP
jgi:hypothetical protein